MNTHFRHSVAIGVIMAILCEATGVTKTVLGDDAADSARLERITVAFVKIDQNRNGTLSLEEWLSNRESPKVAKRDFLLFDQNQDGTLNEAEFASIPGSVALEDRTLLNDPVQQLVDQVQSAMDESFDDWDKNPEREIELERFMRSFDGSFLKGVIRLNSLPIDRNQDQKISRNEARQLLEHLMGMRTIDGQSLRFLNGRVVSYARFHEFDSNHNQQLERHEFTKAMSTIAGESLDFDRANTDGGDGISISEFGHLNGVGYVDPAEDFQRVDANCDASVDAEELIGIVTTQQLKIFKKAMLSFDLDRDQKLSLDEYRLTMQANPVLNWQKPPVDLNSDGQLELTEFDFAGGLFPLLRMVYFKQLDRNADDRLDESEFPHQYRLANEFVLLSEDGSQLRPWFSFDDHPVIGSPAVSPDGEWIAFDESPVGVRWGEQIYVMNLKEKVPRKICSGLMPSWSADGRFIACSRRPGLRCLADRFDQR